MDTTNEKKKPLPPPKKKVKPQHTLHKGLDLAWRVWLCATGAAVAYVAGVLLLLGAGTASALCVRFEPPHEIFGQTLGCAALAWLTFGAALALLRHSNFRAQHGLTVVCSAVLLFLYINFLRERFYYGDVQDYAKAALNLYNGEPFHNRYLYPPLLATLCQPFAWMGAGENGLMAGIWCLNWAGLVLFFIMLTKILDTYGFGARFAHYLALFFLLVNVPVLRTLGYVQVNFHVMTLILYSFFIYSRNKLLSAIALALAVHLKASPIILVLPFLYARDVKWLLRFGAAMVALFAVTFCFYGWQPFASFLANADSIYSANGAGLLFRDCSVDNVIRTLAHIYGVWTHKAPDAMLVKAWVILVKAPLLAAALFGVHHSMKQKPWKNRKDALGNVLNSLPPLLFVMVFASPLVWEHHFVFLSLPFFLLLKKMQTTAEWVVYGFAYMLVILMPTFDFYPLSFCRLAGAGLLFYLCVKAARQNNTHWFGVVSERFEGLRMF